jgi:hypothetical protein
LESILGREGFPELKLEIGWPLELRLEQQQQQGMFQLTPNPVDCCTLFATIVKGRKEGKERREMQLLLPPHTYFTPHE